MKYNKNKNIIKAVFASLAFATLAFTSCTDGFEELNNNPNGINEENIPIASRFIQPQHSIYLNYQNKDYEYQLQQNLNADLYSGYMGNPTPFGGNLNNSTYVMNDGWNNMSFKSGILYVMKPISEILRITKEPDYIAIAKIIRVAAMHRVTDTYGPVPYSKAMQGGSVVEYDSQEEVYTAFFNELDESVNLLTDFIKSGKATPDRLSFDNMCKQKHEQWIKFANTLRLRLAMRIVKVNPQKAKEEAEKSVNNKYGVLKEGDANVEVINKTLTNPLRTIAVNYNDICIGASYESIMKGYNDPRLPLQALAVGWNEGEDIHDEKGKNLGYIGQIKGIRQGALVNKDHYKMYSIVKFDVKDPDKTTTKYPLPIMKVAEAYFLRAEGALRGWNMGGDAKSLYEKGIKVSFDQYALSSNAYNKYIADNKSVAADYTDPYNPKNDIKGMNNVVVKWDNGASNETKLQQIITQKWIAIFPEGQEAWSEFRRTGYPKLFPVANNLSTEASGVIPEGEFVKRLVFTQDERNSNMSTVNDARKLLNGPDKINTRLWWDVDKPNF